MPRIDHIPFYNRMEISDSHLTAVAAIAALPLVFLLLWKPVLAIAYVLVPLCFFLIIHGPTAIVFLIIASFVFVPLTQGIVLLPVDLAAIILVAAYAVDLFSRGPVPTPNRLANPYLLYVFVMLLSISLKMFTAFSVKYFMHQVLLFLTFLAVAHFGRRTNILYILIAYVIGVAGNSIYSMVQFLKSGGTIRAFGLAGLGSADHAMIGFLVSLIFYIWSRDVRTRVLWGIMILLSAGGIIVAQTRASAITAGWGLVAVIIWALWKSKKARNNVPVKNLTAVATLALLIIPPLILYTPVFAGIAYRFGRLGLQPTETVLLRVTLWKAALAGFLLSPILGIGAGNFALIQQWVPDVKFSPVYHVISGLSTHNVFLGALVEGGLIGFSILVFLFIRAVRVSYRNFSDAAAEREFPIVQSLFIIALVIIGSSIYAGAWFWGNNSYHMAVFFGLISTYRPHPAFPVVEKKAP